MDLYRDAVSLLRVLALAVGVLVIFLGIVRAARVARGGGGRAADSILGHASLGLEFFVGATLLNLVLSPTLTAAAATAATIVVRKLLTLSLGLAARGGE